MLGPIIGRWNKYLELRFPLRSRGEGTTSFYALSKRVLVDQIVMAPIGVGPREKNYMRLSFQ
jgi:protein Mpv17